MYDQNNIISSLIDKKCFICQSSIKLVESSECIIYACGLTYNDNNVFTKGHYIIKIYHDGYCEFTHIKYKGKNYYIIQWHDNFLLIDVRDDKDFYLGSVDINVDVKSKTFDFLNNDLEKILNRLRVILTFQ